MALDVESAKLGVIGAGTLASALVTGLARRAGRSTPVILSPRSSSRGLALEAEFAHVRRVSSNPSVVDAADIVMLAVRPQDFAEAVQGLRFRPDQIVISLLAATPLARVREAAGVARCVRVFASPAVACGPAPMAIFPPCPEIAALLAPLGRVMRLEREAQIDAVFAAAGFMSAFAEMRGVLAAKLVEHGLGSDEAGDFVARMISGLPTIAAPAPTGQPAPASDFETPEGLNARCRRWLQASGCFDQIGRAFDRLIAQELGHR